MSGQAAAMWPKVSAPSLPNFPASGAPPIPKESIIKITVRPILFSLCQAMCSIMTGFFTGFCSETVMLRLRSAAACCQDVSSAA